MHQSVFDQTIAAGQRDLKRSEPLSKQRLAFINREHADRRFGSLLVCLSDLFQNTYGCTFSGGDTLAFSTSCTGGKDQSKSDGHERRHFIIKITDFNLPAVNRVFCEEKKPLENSIIYIPDTLENLEPEKVQSSN